MAQNTIKLQTCTLKQTCTCIPPPSTHSRTESSLAALARRPVVYAYAYIIYKHTGHKTKPCYDGMWAEQPQDNDTHNNNITDLRLASSCDDKSGLSPNIFFIKLPMHRATIANTKVPVASNYCGGLGWKDAGVPKMSLNQESHTASCKRFIENKMLKEEKSSSGFEF